MPVLWLAVLVARAGALSGARARSAAPRTRAAASPVDRDASAVDRRGALPVDRRGALRGLAAAAALPLLLPRDSSAALRGDDGSTIPQAVLLLPEGPPRTVVVTGANSGVGLAGAKLLASRGHRVVCACRTQAKADLAAAACGFGAEAAVCDLADLASVRAFAASVQKVDTLVLNAGLAPNAADKEPKRTKDGFELTIGTNHLGHFLLYSLLEKQLQAPGKRLVVTASPVHDPKSGGGSVGSTAALGDLRGLQTPNFDMVDGGAYDADKAYKDSKLCNMMFTAEASRRLSANGGTANAFSPGLIASPDGFFRYQNPVFARIFDTISRVAGVAETSEFGGAALAFLAADNSFDGVTGGWFDTEPPGKHQLLSHSPSAEAQNVEKQKELWKLSAALVHA
ncbi:hypothetical protein M885DRAFT_484184 [Pelagophyceae sp. CCMP2097]|nr:hypothetical protein M885DRAFT_484184 [Pelagophyceae sp. CCMP2097]